MDIKENMRTVSESLYKVKDGCMTNIHLALTVSGQTGQASGVWDPR